MCADCLGEAPAHITPESLVIKQVLDGTDSRDSNVLIPDLLLRELHDVLSRYCVDGTLDLARAHSSAGGNNLATNILGQGGGTIQRQQDRSLKLSLGTLGLCLADGLGKTGPLAQGEVNEVVDTGCLVGDEIDAPETIACQYRSVPRFYCHWLNLPSVAVAGGEAHEASSQVVLVDETTELAALVRRVANSLVIVANDGLGNKGGEVIVVVPADTLNGNSNVGGGDGVVPYPDIRTNELRLSLGQEVGVGLGGCCRQLGEVLVGHLNKLFVGDAASTDENHAVSSVVVLDVVGEFGSANVADVLLGSQDGATKGLLLECGGVQVVENNLLDLLLNLLRLAQDDVPFPLDGGLLKLGVLEDIGKDIDTLWYVLVKGLGEVDGVLALEQMLDIGEIRSSISYDNIPRCRRSGGRPSSRSQARAAVVSDWPFPFQCVNKLP